MTTFDLSEFSHDAIAFDRRKAWFMWFFTMLLVAVGIIAATGVLRTSGGSPTINAGLPLAFSAIVGVTGIGFWLRPGARFSAVALTLTRDGAELRLPDGSVDLVSWVDRASLASLSESRDPTVREFHRRGLDYNRSLLEVRRTCLTLEAFGGILDAWRRAGVQADRHEERAYASKYPLISYSINYNVAPSPPGS